MLWKHDIQKDYVVLRLLCKIDRLFAVISSVYFHSVLFQTETDAFHDQFFIINHQNLCHVLTYSLYCNIFFYFLKGRVLDARHLQDIFYFCKTACFLPITDDILRPGCPDAL